jgi:low affinity Fe/Cu permease
LRLSRGISANGFGDRCNLRAPMSGRPARGRRSRVPFGRTAISRRRAGDRSSQRSERGEKDLIMRRLITQLGVYTASPLAFVVLIAYAVLWYIFKPETLEWHAVATLATLCMTLVIQRAEHRDTQAIHAKLDEILHALGDARNEMTRVDEEEPEEIEKRRDRKRKDD